MKLRAAFVQILQMLSARSTMLVLSLPLTLQHGSSVLRFLTLIANPDNSRPTTYLLLQTLLSTMHKPCNLADFVCVWPAVLLVGTGWG